MTKSCSTLDSAGALFLAHTGNQASILLVGEPGVGKTTLLRDIAYQLSTTFGMGRYVCVIDSNGEITGEGEEPHPSVGKARRFLVGDRDQAKVMRAVVMNHSPKVCDRLPSMAGVVSYTLSGALRQLCR